MQFRIGVGFDVHKFVKSDKNDNSIILGGIYVPCKYLIDAHSDGDVVLHAITDAVLGSLALGDIGDHFPPSDQTWKGADSAIFLRHAYSMIKAKGWDVSNVDIVVMCEHPKLQEFKKDMAKSIARIIEINPDQVCVKATTTEKLGFTGREEGIAVTANCLVYKQ
jgi:2-C-methyl-D-erythritol 2,4-cyclodiphosphate synthase